MMIFPAHENMKTVARQLLELAEHPRQVEFVSWPQAGFKVPDELFAAWEASLPRDEHGDPVINADPVVVRTHTNPVTKADIESAAAREASEDSAAKRKPGRPKKSQGGQ